MSSRHQSARRADHEPNHWQDQHCGGRVERDCTSTKAWGKNRGVDSFGCFTWRVDGGPIKHFDQLRFPTSVETLLSAQCTAPHRWP